MYRKILLVLILAVGSLYRFYNLNWDSGYFFHPDERNIAVAVGKITSLKALDPGFFAYNGLWIYLVRLFALGGDIASWTRINLLARTLSAAFSSASLVLVFWLARLYFRHLKMALVATTFSAFTVGYLQYAHYGVTESLLVFLCLLLTIATAKRRWWWAALIAGLALGTKTSAAAFLIIPLTGYLLETSRTPHPFSFLVRLPLFTLFTLFVFVLVSPYSLLDSGKFLESMRYEGAVVSGRLKVPYTLQFASTPVYLYQFGNLLWHLGPLLAVFGVVGLLLFLGRSLYSRSSLPLPGLMFALFYTLYVGSWYTKFIRYLLPVYPFLILSAVWLLFQLKNFRVVYLASMILLLTSSFGWSSAYLNVYTQPSTRLTASDWIYLNVPPQSTILTEHWDDRVPTDLTTSHPAYNFIELTNYDPDTSAKISQLADQLAAGDYLILSSRRLSGSIGRAVDQYPLTSRYYQLLLAEKLGYKLIKKFSVYPQLGPLVINDDAAEETFQVYDHPTVLIFRNDHRLTPTQIQQFISAEERT